MKKIIILIFHLLALTYLHGQSLTEKIAVNACEYLDSVDNISSLQDSIQNSIVKAMTNFIIGGTATLEEKKRIDNVQEFRRVLSEAYEILPSYCYNVRKLIIEEKQRNYYKISNNDLANQHFEKGNVLLMSGDHKKSIKEFKSAIKFDNNFVYAIDHLAHAYRKLENFKKAINYYQNSLDIFPEGHVALLNSAVIYLFMEEDDNSLKYYEQLKYLYSDNPEGYFGIAKIKFMHDDYEKALDNLFIAHRIYSETNAVYLKDSEQLIEIIFTKLKELNMQNLIDKKIKEHNMIFNE